MTKGSSFDVIIIGGSYAGLSAAMALGRSLRNVLLIDSGKPCNRQTPHSHNFLTQDGKTPKEIAALARQQVARYETITFLDGVATKATPLENGFAVSTLAGDAFTAKKLVLATGIKDQMPPINGFAECWGISVIHCPYCHGYEVRHEKTGILENGQHAFEFARMIHQWTKDLALFTNGASTLTTEQTEKLKEKGISIVEKAITGIEHSNGHIQHLIFEDGSTTQLKALYARLPFVQHSDIPAQLGCTLTQQGYIQVDAFQKTSVAGVFACGDNSSMMRSVSVAVATGTMAGAMTNKEIIEEEF